MSAPEAVVRRVQEAQDAHVPLPLPDGTYLCNCRAKGDGAEMDTHLSQVAADAAHAASLEWAAEKYGTPGVAATTTYVREWLRSWAGEGS